MDDSFLEDGVDMAYGSNTLDADAAQEIRDSLAHLHVCPFCGAVKDQPGGQCGRCTMENSPASRQATKSRIGPWYVLQTRNPAAPGMKFETLLGFVRKGRVKPRSVVRGPTTHQLWRFAAQVKGLSREFGVCFSCGGAVERNANLCPHCNRLQEPPINPNAFVEGQQEAEAAPGPSSMSIPVYREIASPPLVAEDIVVPPLGPLPIENPDAGADAGKSRKGSDGFLSAKDLAAAFKLNFNGPDSEARARSSAATVGGTLARRGQPHQHAARTAAPRIRRKRRWGRYVVLVLLLGAGGAYAYEFNHDPIVHARSIEYYNQASAWCQEQWKAIGERSSSAKPAERRSAAAAMPSAPAARATEGQPPSAGEHVAAGSPAGTAAGPSASRPDQWDQMFHGSPAKPNAGTSAPPVQHYRDGTFDDVRSLYSAAIDAEAQHDYAAAVKKYEEIQQFSPDLWPRDLALRLKEAKLQAQ